MHLINIKKRFWQFAGREHGGVQTTSKFRLCNCQRITKHPSATSYTLQTPVSMLNIKVECAQTPTNRSNTVKKSGLKLLHNVWFIKKYRKLLLLKVALQLCNPSKMQPILPTWLHNRVLNLDLLSFSVAITNKHRSDVTLGICFIFMKSNIS